MNTTPLKLKAEKCVKSQNLELAQKIYQQILQMDPQDIVTRQNYRALNVAVYENNGKKSPSALKSAILNLKLNMAGKKHEKIMKLADQILAIDPYNVKVMVKQGLSALELKYFETSTNILEAAVASNPKDIEPLRHLANIYGQKGGRENLKKATHFAQLMLELEPRNKEIQDFCRKLDADLAQMPFEKVNFMEGLASKEDTIQREKDEQLIRTDQEAEHAIKMLRKKAEEDPSNPKTYEKIGDLLVRLRRNKEAQEAFTHALKLNPANSIIQVKLGDISINEVIWKIQSIREKLEKDPNNAQLKAELQKLETEKYKISVAEFEKRVEQQPTVSLFKFNLAKLYFQDKKKSHDAIRLFQITCKEPTYRTDSLIYLGKLFSMNSDYDLAVTQFDEAIQAIAGFDSRKKDTLYSKADALEKLGELEEAKQTFQSILVEDISYRDVAKRIDALKEKTK